MTVSMSAVWDRTTEFLGDRAGAVAGIAAVAIFIPNAVTETLAPLKTSAGPGLKLGLGLLAVVFTIVSLWGQLAIIALALDRAGGAAEARAHAARRLGPMILVGLAMLVVAVLLVLPVFGTLMANGVDLSRFGQPGAQQTLTPGGSAFIALYLLILLPIALWLLARFVVLSAAVVVAENETLGALGRAFRLTRRLAWKIIGVLVLYGVVMFVAGLAAVTVFGALFSFLLGGDGAITLAGGLTAVVKASVTAIFSAIATVFTAKLYVAARDREGAATA